MTYITAVVSDLQNPPKSIIFVPDSIDILEEGTILVSGSVDSLAANSSMLDRISMLWETREIVEGEIVGISEGEFTVPSSQTIFCPLI